MSDALVGGLIGGVIGLLGSVLVQVIVTWREDRLHKQDTQSIDPQFTSG